MKSTPVLRVTLRSSRLEALLLAVGTVVTAALLSLLPGEVWLRCGAIVIAGACGIHGLRRAGTIGTRRWIESIELGADRRAVVTDRSGCRIEGVIQPESYVGAMLATLVLRPDGARRSRALAIWPDAIATDDFRRLRVMLRHAPP